LEESHPFVGISIDQTILVDNTKDQNWEFIELQRYIIEGAEHQEQWEKKIPAKWLALERYIMKEKAHGKKVLSMSTIKDLNVKTALRVEELKTFLKYDVTYFKSITN